MENELTVRELTQAQTLVFSHNTSDIPFLLRLLATYVETSNATLLSVSYTNEDEGGFHERLTATVECPWQS